MRTLWGILAMGAISAYFSHGLNLSIKPEAMTWEEFSGNREAMQHFAERNEILWDGSPARTQVLQKVFEKTVTENREFAQPKAPLDDETESRMVWVARLQQGMRSFYNFWQPRGSSYHGHAFRFSALGQLRWNMVMTIGVLLGLIVMCTAGINLFERKAGV